jgi:hypothetical protein
MRWVVLLVLALPLAACRETVVFVQTPNDGGPGAGGAAGFDGGPALCTGFPTGFELESPEVIVALDRSTGMTTERLGNTSALAVVRQALDETSMRFQKVVRFGYVEFPGVSQVCTACGSCAGSLSAPMANLEGFTLFLHACEQPNPSCPESEWRPTAAALARAADAFVRFEPISRYVLLITNGQPDCSMGQSSGCNGAQMLARDLYNQQQVATIVLAPGQVDQYTVSCLEDLAMSGGARSNYHPAPMAADISRELDNITREIAMNACHLDLFSRVENENRAEVFWGNIRVPHSQEEGWDLEYNNSFEIVLHGTWCDKLLADGPAGFQVFANCNPRP